MRHERERWPVAGINRIKTSKRPTMAGKDDDDDDRRRARGGTAIPSRGDLTVLSFAISITTLSVTYFFYHNRILIHPRQFPHWSVLDAEKKDDERGPGLNVWEVLVCISIPLLAWRHRYTCSRSLAQIRHVRAQMMRRNKCTVLALVGSLAFAMIGARNLVLPLLTTPDCTGWMETDVGYIRGHRNAAQMGVSMRTLCSGRTWEPHVAKVIDEHLYGQGRALDVGAFVGYHTIHMAKRAAPFGVVAFDGRINSDLRANVQRNNAQNAVRIVETTIDKTWKLDDELERDLLDDDHDNKGPVVFAKIDCEGCELNFLKGAKSVFEKYHPVIVVEVQDNDSRRNTKVGGQQIVNSTDTREEVLDYLRKELGYTHVEALEDEDGNETWDYLAYRMD